MVAETLTRPTDDITTTANQLLVWLVDHASRDWEDIMTAQLTDKELELNLRNVETKLAELGLENPYGAIAGGTGIAKEHAGLDGEDSQRAIQLLKAEGRLQQCGRGRGKCLVILQAEPLTTPAVRIVEVAEPVIGEEQTQPDGEPIRSNDVPNLLRAARDEYRVVKRNLEAASRQNRLLTKRMTELEKLLETKDEELTALNNKFEEMAATTWR